MPVNKMSETENIKELEAEVRNAIMADFPEATQTPVVEEETPKKAKSSSKGKSEPKEKKPAAAAKNVQTRAERMQESRSREKERHDTQLERDERNMTWQLIQSAQRTGSFMSGKIISVEETPEGSVHVTATINGIKVIIPADEMGIASLLDSDAVDAKDRQKREKQLLVKNLGSIIEFVIVSASLVEDLDNPGQKKPLAIASRKKALLRKIQDNYLPKKDAPAKIKVGDIVRECQILSVGTHGIRVEIGGIDASIPKYLLSYKFLTDLNREFRVGQKIDVLVQEIKKNETGILTVVASHKHALADYYRKNLKDISVDGVYMGTITVINGDRATVYLDDKNVVAMTKILKVYGTNSLPAAGDNVIFIVKNILEEKGFALGMITKVMKNS